MSEIRGELRILKNELNSADEQTKKDALKKVIVYMSVGRDVSPIFHSVIKCIELPDLEIKKLIYLYIINYSRSRPNDAIMIIHQFCRDIEKKSDAIIRALAFRTMGCLRVHGLNEYLVNPLTEGLSDTNAYVRKTAVMCVPKVFEVSPDLIKNNQIIERLQTIFKEDHNHTVVANSIQALHEISRISKTQYLEVDADSLDRILVCLNETFVWGQVFILDVLADYHKELKSQAEKIIEKTLSRLSHINTSIVFSTFKVICTYLQFIDAELREALFTKLRPALKISYNVLRYLRVIVKIYTNIIGDEYSYLICDYDDPFYIKLEKMHLMVDITNKKNAKKLLNEFYEYHKELNIDFVKVSLKYIYKIALKVSSEAPYALFIYSKILGNLNQSSELFNDVAIGATIIIRSFPMIKGGTEFVKDISKVYKNLREQEAIVSFLWLLGEYCEKVEDSGKILEHFSSDFFSHTSAVQLQTLNSGIKMYLNEIEPIDEVLHELLQQISEKSKSPDLRDRAYIYWRLLYLSPEKTSEVIFNKIPPIEVEDDEDDDNETLKTLIHKGGTVSNHLGKDLSTVFTKEIGLINRGTEEVEKEVIIGEGAPGSEKKTSTKTAANKVQDIIGNDNNLEDAQTQEIDIIGGEIDLIGIGGGDDLIGGGDLVGVTTIAQNTNNNDLLVGDTDLIGGVAPGGTTQQEEPDLFGLGNAGNDDLIGDDDDDEDDLFADEGDVQQQAATFVNMTEEVLLRRIDGGKNGRSGVEIKGYFSKGDANSNQILLNLTILNTLNQVLNNFKFQLRPNFFGLKFQKLAPFVINPNSSHSVQLIVNINQKRKIDQLPIHPFNVDLAFKSNLDLFFIKVPIHLHLILSPRGELSYDDFNQTWNSIAPMNQSEYSISPLTRAFKNTEFLKNKLKANNLFTINHDDFGLQQKLHISSRAGTQEFVLVNLSIDSGNNSCQIFVRGENSVLNDLVYHSLLFITNN